MYIKNLGKIIKYERKSWGMSKRRLAYLSHCEVELIEEIESGIEKNPDFFMMLNICDVLEISVFDLMKRKGKK